MYREHIMAVAEGLFSEDGFENTKMQDIASAAEISLGTLYHTCKSKNELYRQLLIMRDRQMLEVVMGKGMQLLEQPESVAQLLWLTDAQIRFLLEHDSYLRIQLQEGYAWYHPSAQPSKDEQGMWEQGLRFIEKLLEWGIEKNLFVPGNTSDHARMIITMQQTRLANWVIDDMRETHDKVIAHVQADFIRQFCRPEVATGMLSADGAGLSDDTLARLRELDQSVKD